MAIVTPSPAATLLLVRDRDGLDVLMVQRHGDMRFGPGALVFPGGKVDAQDLDPSWHAQALGFAELDPQSRGRRICAIRETFEETGILLARPRNDGDIDHRAAALRTAVMDGDLPFQEMVIMLGLRLDLNDLIPFARWITPTRQPIRFDATFYIARAPEGQRADCDQRETVSAEWLKPDEALRLAETGERKLMRPTRANLSRLAADACVGSALRAARARPIVTVLQDD